MKLLSYLALLLLVPLAVFSQIKTKEEVAAEAKAQIKEIQMDTLSDWLTAQEDILLVDVRTKAEYDAAHLQGATWVPRGRLEVDMPKVTSDPNQKIVVYCRTGGRAALGAIALEDIGYQNVVSLDGGFKSWVEAGRPVYNMHGKLKVMEYLAPETTAD